MNNVPHVTSLGPGFEPSGPVGKGTPDNPMGDSPKNSFITLGCPFLIIPHASKMPTELINTSAVRNRSFKVMLENVNFSYHEEKVSRVQGSR